ncbi:hypothetical protein MRX96_030735 [Rhipicephalus microplus]
MRTPETRCCVSGQARLGRSRARSILGRGGRQRATRIGRAFDAVQARLPPRGPAVGGLLFQRRLGGSLFSSTICPRAFSLLLFAEPEIPRRLLRLLPRGHTSSADLPDSRETVARMSFPAWRNCIYPPWRVSDRLHWGSRHELSATPANVSLAHRLAAQTDCYAVVLNPTSVLPCSSEWFRARTH